MRICGLVLLCLVSADAGEAPAASFAAEKVAYSLFLPTGPARGVLLDLRGNRLPVPDEAWIAACRRLDLAYIGVVHDVGEKTGHLLSSSLRPALVAMATASRQPEIATAPLLPMIYIDAHLGRHLGAEAKRVQASLWYSPFAIIATSGLGSTTVLGTDAGRGDGVRDAQSRQQLYDTHGDSQSPGVVRSAVRLAG